MKVSFSILNMPDGRWHWVMRLWEHGLDHACTVYAAKATKDTARAALDEAMREYSIRARLEPSPVGGK